MTLPLIAALIYLLLSTRIMADVQVEIGAVRKGIRIRLSAWGLRLMIDKPIEFHWDREKAGEQGKRLKVRWPLIRAALRAVRWGQTEGFLQIGLGDAAGTAMAAGGIQSAFASLQAFLSPFCPCDVRVAPDFQKPCFACSAHSIFSAAPGDIMFAVAWAAVKMTQREGFSWLSIPLKA